MKKFPTKYDVSERNSNLHSNSGRDTIYKYHKIHKMDGSQEIEIDKSNSYSMSELINKYKDDVDIEVLYKRYLNGDLSAIDKNKGVYIDVTEAPKRISDFLSMLDTQQEIFNAMPIEYKQKFNNDYKQYGVALENGTAEEKYNEFVRDYNAKFGGSMKKAKAQAEIKEIENKNVSQQVVPSTDKGGEE